MSESGFDWGGFCGPDRGLAEALKHQRVLPGVPSQFGELPEDWPGPLLWASRTCGIDRPYQHQLEALDHLEHGRDVLLTTPTASGKSFVFQAHAARTLLEEPDARILLIFPLKALARDQEAKWGKFLHGLGEGHRVEVFDGDTSSHFRKKIKANPPEVLITNPDMLHLSILPGNEDWHEYLKNLNLVVIDEAHMYRGIFGAHVHHVLKRLERQVKLRGGHFQVAAASATMGHPLEFFKTLTRRDASLVERRSTAQADRHVALFNPSGSPYTLALKLLIRLLEQGKRTLVFTKARKVTELIFSWLKESHPHLAEKVSSYRAGFLPEERRAIEAALFRGDLMGVVSTSAMEVGIDIGGLDAVVLVGYPGSVMSTFQRFGRAGRGESPGLLALVAQPDALDQYFIKRPDELLNRSFERLVLDPANPNLALPHLACNAYECPIPDKERFTWPDKDQDEFPAAQKAGLLSLDESGETWYSLRQKPQREVSLRSTGESYDIKVKGKRDLLGTISSARAYAECHPGAIYLHRGKSFEILTMDRDKKDIWAREARVDYFTQARSSKETEILSVEETKRGPNYLACFGKLKITTHTTHFVKKRIRGQDIIGEEPLDLPPQIMVTEGFWWQISSGVREAVNTAEGHYMGGLHGAEHCAIGLFPLLSLSDRWDIGGLSTPLHPQTRGAAVFIYDGYPGGMGLARSGFDDLQELIEKTYRHLSECPCEIGCPSCIQSPKCGSGNKPLDKTASVTIMGALAGHLDVAKGDPMETPLLPLGDSNEEEEKKEQPTGAVPAGLLVLDVETQRAADEVEGGWSRPDRMGVALSVIYDADKDEYRTYYEDDTEALCVELLDAKVVVGFNHERFDMKVLQPFSRHSLSEVNTLDLLTLIHKSIGFRVGLGHLGEINLGEAKSADGLQSIRWYREGKMDLIAEYCKKDVEITWRLYQHAREHGFLKYKSRNGAILQCPLQID